MDDLDDPIFADFDSVMHWCEQHFEPGDWQFGEAPHWMSFVFRRAEDLTLFRLAGHNWPSCLIREQPADDTEEKKS